MKNRSLLWAFVLWGSAALLWVTWRPGFSNTFQIVGFLALLLCAFSATRASLEDGFLLLTAMVPFEYSVRRWGFPSFSPIDLVCISLAFGLFYRVGARPLFDRTLRLFSRVGIFFWIGFLIWGIAVAFLNHGRVAQVLRWGEFLFFLVYLSALSPESFPGFARRLAQWLAVMGAGLSAMALLQYVMSDANFMKTFATFGQKNVFAAYLSLALPLTLGLARFSRGVTRGGIFIAIAVMGLALLVSLSRGAVVALVGSVVFLTLFSHRENSIPSSRSWQMALLAIFLLGVGVLIGRASNARDWSSSNGRLLYVSVASRIVKDHPVSGVGPGNFLNVLPDYLSSRQLADHESEVRSRGHADFWQHLHNLYLQISVDYGVPGLMLWVVGLLFLIVPLYRYPPDPLKAWSWAFPYMLLSLTAFLLHNTVDILFVSSLDVLFAAYVAMSRSTQNA